MPLCRRVLRVQLQIGKNAPSERNSSRLDGVAATFSSTYGRCRLSPDPLPARARCHSKARSHRGITAVGRHAGFAPVVRRVGPRVIVESKLRDRLKPTTGAAERDAPGTERRIQPTIRRFHADTIKSAESHVATPALGRGWR